MTIETIPAVTINAPEFFAREDFQAWLNAERKNGGGHPATWHNRGEAPGDYADTFIIHDDHDGSDYDELFPDDIQTYIRLRCEDMGFTYGIIRLTNLAE